MAVKNIVKHAPGFYFAIARDCDYELWLTRVVVCAFLWKTTCETVRAHRKLFFV